MLAGRTSPCQRLMAVRGSCLGGSTSPTSDIRLVINLHSAESRDEPWTMVETRSGLSAEPPSEEEGEEPQREGSPSRRAARQKDTATTGAATGGEGEGGGAPPLTDSQAYTLLALALALLALPCIVTPKLVRLRRWQGGRTLPGGCCTYG